MSRKNRYAPLVGFCSWSSWQGAIISLQVQTHACIDVPCKPGCSWSTAYGLGKVHTVPPAFPLAKTGLQLQESRFVMSPLESDKQAAAGELRTLRGGGALDGPPGPGGRLFQELGGRSKGRRSAQLHPAATGVRADVEAAGVLPGREFQAFQTKGSKEEKFCVEGCSVVADAHLTGPHLDASLFVSAANGRPAAESVAGSASQAGVTWLVITSPRIPRWHTFPLPDHQHRGQTRSERKATCIVRPLFWLVLRRCRFLRRQFPTCWRLSHPTDGCSLRNRWGKCWRSCWGEAGPGQLPW